MKNINLEERQKNIQASERDWMNSKVHSDTGNHSTFNLIAL